jgi:hypothetical protein
MKNNMEYKGQKQNFQLPQIKDIKIKEISYKPPKLRYFKSSSSKYSKAIEFTVITDAPIPVRALSPVLYVGKIPIIEGGPIKESLYRFLSFETNKLKVNQPIYFGWYGEPEELRIKTNFIYKGLTESGAK